ncbi:MAG TPA: MgtC/SapB family protein [Kofleriaceae bacterium]|nr:MgtC/SapB family protein [Kofleriaceae bacterium]
MNPDAVEILASLGVALAAGFLVGAEREQVGQTSFGGVRTFPLIALAGAIAMLLGWVGLAVIGVLFGALIGIAYYRDSARAEGLGMSTEVAAVVTFGLGALCTASGLGIELRDRLLLVAAGATGTLALLTVKRPLHKLMDRLSQQDVFATTKLLVLSVIVLPLLPDQQLGPWGAINPRAVGILAVLISGISFAGYAAIRAFGAHRGIGLTGLLGGLASSTAVTLSFAGRARAQRAMTHACAVAIILASATMFPRLLVEVAAVSPSLAGAASWPLLTTGGVAFLIGVFLYWRLARRARHEEETPAGELELGNPFSVWGALKFALLFVVILVVSTGAQRTFADVGIYLSAALTGLADADAISLSIARLHRQQEVASDTALVGVAIAAASNTISKIGLAALLGTPALGARVGLALLAGLVAGAAVLFVGMAL